MSLLEALALFHVTSADVGSAALPSPDEAVVGVRLSAPRFAAISYLLGTLFNLGRHKGMGNCTPLLSVVRTDDLVRGCTAP